MSGEKIVWFLEYKEKVPVVPNTFKKIKLDAKLIRAVVSEAYEKWSVARSKYKSREKPSQPFIVLDEGNGHTRKFALK